MTTFADKLIGAIRQKGNPCIVGLDPRIPDMPDFVKSGALARHGNCPDAISHCIVDFNRLILNTVADLVAAVKPQIAFYEQYGVAGLAAFTETIRIAKELGLLVIVDAKRGDIASTAQAYANAFLGKSVFLDAESPVYDVDCITVSPFLGEDSLEPFVEACQRFGKGIFILVKTSNPGSADIQDVELGDGSNSKLYTKVARMVARLASNPVGTTGYSSIGAVVGGTFPKEATLLRNAMPRSIFLVPGFGAQGGRPEDVARCFNRDGLGAVVNASRSITYAFGAANVAQKEFEDSVRNRTIKMIGDVNSAIRAGARV